MKLWSMWVAGIVLLAGAAAAQITEFSVTHLPVPPRPANAKPWSRLREEITSLPLAAREEVLFREIVSGNVPDFDRWMVPVTASAEIDGSPCSATYLAMSDYLAVGSDTDFCRIPMTPILAQRIADELASCTLPTCKMVVDIWDNAEAKFFPQPIPPGPTMSTVPVFDQHNGMIEAQRTTTAPLGMSIAGIKKDIVITPKLADKKDRVAIFGWHWPNGARIQPLYLGHAIWYADYSHGVRLVLPRVRLQGLVQSESTVNDILGDPRLCRLLSDEGVTTVTRYRTDLGAYPKETTGTLAQMPVTTKDITTTTLAPTPAPAQP
jgi:hypothetical protein